MIFCILPLGNHTKKTEIGAPQVETKVCYVSYYFLKICLEYTYSRILPRQLCDTEEISLKKNNKINAILFWNMLSDNVLEVSIQS